jgi:alpha-tubulin suppressor-like RCC1 family protein
VLAGLVLAGLLAAGIGVAAVVGGPDGQVRTLLGQIMAGGDPVHGDPLEHEPFGAWRDQWGEPSPDVPAESDPAVAAVDPTTLPDDTTGVVDTVGDERTAGTGIPAALQRASPARQDGEVDTPLPQPLSVRLIDEAGVPVPDRWVHFRVASGEGTLSADSVLTSSGGMAAVGWTLGSSEGDQRVVAFLPDADNVTTVFDVAASLPSLGVRSGVTAGGTHSCTLRSNGQITCWGDNARGQLGLPGGRRLAPGAALAGGPWARLTSGVAHTCALTLSGSAFCWGANDRGQLGTGDTSPRSAPAEVAGEHLFREITAGAAHTCGVRMDGAVLCWGDNARGQLGTGSAAASSVPATVSGTARFRAVAAGWNHTCAIDSGGAAYCWGSNASGELGTGQIAARTTSPQRVAGGGTFQEISAGNAHSCARTGAGEIRCWGDNGAGQLGDDSNEARRTPVAVMGGGRFTSVVAGAVHTCAVNEGGGAVCWGRNIYGQLGDGSTQDRAAPTSVEGAVRFQRLHAIGSHTCGQTPGGDLFCWGYNAEGQLGDGTRENRTRPVAVSGADR